MKYVFIAIAVGIFLLLWKSVNRKKKIAPEIPEPKEDDLLTNNVRFYAHLNEADQEKFRTRIGQFLAAVTITPVGDVVLTDLDKLYVASAAIIPIFAHDGWMYNNLNEVLIYPGSFTKDFIGNAEDSNVQGMVGSGAMNRMMILSIGALRAGFQQASTHNTGIHEFAHLLDKADGAVDGLPEEMLPNELEQEWLQNMNREIKKIRQGDSDINSYAGTNEAEFFAVVSEYFFQKPDKMKTEHPVFWKLLEAMYKPEEASSSKSQV